MKWLITFGLCLLGLCLLAGAIINQMDSDKRYRE